MSEKLSIIIPVYNEEGTVLELLEKVQKVNLSIDKEIILVNDGSTDNSKNLIENYIKKNPNNIILYNKKNGGKGSALKYGFKKATGSIFIIQDADLEYDPSDYQNCIDPILSGDAEVVYGSRRIEKSNKKYSGILYFIGGSLLTMFVNVLCFSWITDSACCYKTFRKETLLKYMPEGNSFTWDFQISVILLSNGIKIHEVPSKYYPRDKSEGKKINYKDFIKCIFAIIVARVKKR